MELEELKDERDKLNKETKELAVQRRETTSRVKRLRTELLDAKKRRDEENDKVQEFKSKRDAANEKIKAKIAELNKLQDEMNALDSKAGVPIRQAKKELERLEWQVQTQVLDVKTEEKLAKKIAELEKTCESGEKFFEKRKELKAITSALDELRKEAQAYHEMMLQHAKESERFHGEVKEYYQQIKKLEPEFKEIHQKISEARKVAEEAHQTYVEKYKEEKGAVEAERAAKAKRKVKGMKKEADQLMKDFMEGKKLTTEELAIIQSFGDEK